MPDSVILGTRVGHKILFVQLYGVWHTFPLTNVEFIPRGESSMRIELVPREKTRCAKKRDVFTGTPSVCLPNAQENAFTHHEAKLYGSKEEWEQWLNSKRDVSAERIIL